MLSTAIAATVAATSPSNFTSVKLPTHIVANARAAAQPMRRSVASQIEYWATLGLALEHKGLSTHEARTAIETYEAAIASKQAAADSDKNQRRAVVAKLRAGMIDAHTSGALNIRMGEVIEGNRQNGLRLAALKITGE